MSELPKDVQALAAELLATAAGYSDTMWEEDTIHYLNKEFTAQIAAFCQAILAPIKTLLREVLDAHETYGFLDSHVVDEVKSILDEPKCGGGE